MVEVEGIEPPTLFENCFTGSCTQPTGTLLPNYLVPLVGLEPTHLSVPDPKSGVSTNFTIEAWLQMRDSNPRPSAYETAKLPLLQSALMAAKVGIEPTTSCLTDKSSTTELQRNRRPDRWHIE